MSEQRSGEDTPGGTRRADASMSLLNDLLWKTLDEDYAPATARRGAGEREHGPGGVIGLITVVALFGLLVVTAALQANRAAPAVEEERAQLIQRIDEESREVERLRATVASLERDVADLENRVLLNSQVGQSLAGRLDRLGATSGTQPVTGPGMVITADDAPPTGADRVGQVLDTDLQKLVNALWVAGAEAVSINGQRINGRTAIRGAGSAITVNYRSLTRPYVIRAIGDPDSLPARLLETEGGRAWLDLHQNFGVRFTTETRRSITVPGLPMSQPRFARVPGGTS
ncbi:MAG: DUF881 domain-containing protein [Nocardioidaceae bacterium]